MSLAQLDAATSPLERALEPGQVKIHTGKIPVGVEERLRIVEPLGELSRPLKVLQRPAVLARVMLIASGHGRGLYQFASLGSRVEFLQRLSEIGQAPLVA